jgi:hypothetical protein
MESEKPPTQIELAPQDIAFVIRRDGERKLIIPEQYDTEFAPEDHLMLVSFALAIDEERVRSLMAEILTERQALLPARPEASMVYHINGVQPVLVLVDAEGAMLSAWLPTPESRSFVRKDEVIADLHDGNRITAEAFNAFCREHGIDPEVESVFNGFYGDGQKLFTIRTKKSPTPLPRQSSEPSHCSIRKTHPSVPTLRTRKAARRRSGQKRGHARGTGRFFALSLGPKIPDLPFDPERRTRPHALPQGGALQAV